MWCSPQQYKHEMGTGHAQHNNNWGDYHSYNNLQYTLPGKQYCNIIVIAAASPQSGTRNTALLFRDNSLRLPDGVYYLDDHEKVGFSHNGNAYDTFTSFNVATSTTTQH